MPVTEINYTIVVVLYKINISLSFVDEEMEPEKAVTPAPRVVVKHNVLGSRQVNQYVLVK